MALRIPDWTTDIQVVFWDGFSIAYSAPTGTPERRVACEVD